MYLSVFYQRNVWSRVGSKFYKQTHDTSLFPKREWCIGARKYLARPPHSARCGRRRPCCRRRRPRTAAGEGYERDLLLLPPIEPSDLPRPTLLHPPPPPGVARRSRWRIHSHCTYYPPFLLHLISEIYLCRLYAHLVRIGNWTLDLKHSNCIRYHYATKTVNRILFSFFVDLEWECYRYILFQEILFI